MKLANLLLLIAIFIIGNNAFGQITCTYQVAQLSCIKSIGHNYQEQGDGTILVTATGGVPPYRFYIYGISGLVSFTQNNGYFPGLMPGNYFITAYDALNHSGTEKNIVLTASSPTPVLNVLGKDSISGCNGMDGAIRLSAQNGTSPYLFSIDGGASFSPNGNFTGLSMGAYAVLVKDANGCISNFTSLQNLSGNGIIPAPYISIPIKKNSCIINTYGFYNFSDTPPITSCQMEGGANLYFIYYTDANGNKLGNQSNLVVSHDGINFHTPNEDSYFDSALGLRSGLFRFYIKDTATGLKATYVLPVGQSCDVYINYIFTLASCGASDGSFTVIAKYGVPPYTYSIDGINYQNDSTFKGLAAGTYAVSVKDASGEITSSKATLYNKCPVVAAMPISDTCNLKKGAIQAHGFLGTRPYSFSLDNIKYQSDSLFTAMAKGTYTVYLKDAKGFIDSIIGVQVNEICLNVSASITNENCGHADGTITATGTNGTPPYIFSIYGVNFQNSNFFHNLASGNYILTIKDAGNITTTINVMVGENVYKINLGNDTTLCAGQIITLSPNIAGATYVWQDGSTSSNYTVSKAGQYWVKATSNSCIVFDTINVAYINLGSIFTTHDTTVCIGNTITLNAGHAGANFLWDDNSSQQTRTVNTDGKYWVKISSSGCSVSDTITCHFIPGPIIIFPSDTSFCSTQQLYLNAGNINATYLWSDGTVGSTLVVTKAGTYTVAATANGCTTRDTIKVTIKPNPQIALGNDTTLCTGQTLVLNATAQSPMGVATYFWQDGSTSPIYTVNTKGNYSVKVLANGCDTTGKITISYNAKPIVNIGVDTTLCNSDQLVLNATYQQSNYLWQDGSQKPTFTVTKAGTYQVDVTNYCGTTKDSITIQYEDCDCVFYIPSAFSPNGDGKNDVFKPTYKCFFANYQLNIYSRLGKIIFTSTNADNGWDGMINGLQQPTGVYIWEISYFDTFTNKAVKKSGTMVLVR